MSIQFTARPTPSRRPLVLTVALVAFFTLWHTFGAMFGAVATTSSISGTIWEDVDRDGVVDRSEPTWGNMGVEVYTPDGATRLAKAVTTSDGRWSVGSLSSGDYRVRMLPSSWRDVRETYHPTTLADVWPEAVLTVDGTATFDLGFTRTQFSTDLNTPLSSTTTAGGTIVESFTDAVPAQVIASVIDAGLVGDEAPLTSVRFAYYKNSSYCGTSIGGSEGTFSGFRAHCYVGYLSWLSYRHTTLVHEYGHAWANYHSWVVQQDDDFEGYLEVRGLAGDERLGTSHAWYPGEMIAEDYRQLFGTEDAQVRSQENSDIAPASEVPGLAEYLSGSFMTGSSAEEPEPPTPSPSDTQAPTVAILAPTDDSTLSGVVTATVDVADDVTSEDQLEVTVLLGGNAHTARYDAGAGRWTAALDTTTTPDGTAIVEARARDSGGNSASVAHDVIVDNTSDGGDDETPTSDTGSTGMEVSTASGQVNNGDSWLGWVDVTVTDGGVASPGTVVAATWTGSGKHGGSGTASCTTGTDGSCRLSASEPKRVDAITFSLSSPRSVDVVVGKP